MKEYLFHMGIERWVLRPQKTYALSVVTDEPLVGEAATLFEAILKSIGLLKAEVELVTDIQAVKASKVWVLGEAVIPDGTQVIQTPSLSTLLASPKLKKFVFQRLGYIL